MTWVRVVMTRQLFFVAAVHNKQRDRLWAIQEGKVVQIIVTEKVWTQQRGKVDTTTKTGVTL